MKSIFFLLLNALIVSYELKASEPQVDNKDSIFWSTNARLYQDGVVVGEDKLIFRSELLSRVNCDYWREFCKYQRSQIESKHPLLTGLVAFEEALKNYGSTEKNPYYSLHICFASPTSLDDTGQWPRFSEIEMVLAVFSKPGCPITTHLGITRGANFYGSDKLRHGNISMHLHSFAADTSLRRNPDVKFMVTRPSSMMREILQKNLPGAYYYPGVASEATPGTAAPIDDTANEWRLTGTEITFLRPLWFPRLNETAETIKPWHHPMLLPSLEEQLSSPNASDQFKLVARAAMTDFKINDSNGSLPTADPIVCVDIRALSIFGVKEKAPL